ncbi:hypothetical protein Ahy_B09g097739 [Arachis hypogaea]|uniref:Protein FAR1-RELATED SEQUENCE n=1 Tax=Arachis hypogaea TaxID=3818 RepID=A0A444XPR5_ARAHY|nr:hypothetical protein Ahy_B09g097739 [Arachis hypogaea]
MFKQHRELSMFVRRTIENNEEARVRPSKTYQSFVTATDDAFDKNWNDFLMRYGVEGNKWLSGSREKREREFDAAYLHTVIPCAIKSPIETQFQHVYTHEKFRKVKAQLREKVNCITRSMHSTLGFTTYEVVEQVSNSTFNKFVVTYDAISREVKCQYLLFESRGILYHHSLSVLSFEQSKNIKRRHTHIKSSQDEPLLEPRSKRFDDLAFFSYNICEFVLEFEKLNGILDRTFDNDMVEIQEYQLKSKSKCSLSHKDTALNDLNNLQIFPRLNLLDGGSMIHSSSSLYHAQDINYPREDDRSFGVY